MPRVAFYTRISLDETVQKYSLSAQQERLEAFCTSQYGRDWTLTRVYSDMASGTHLHRPELQQMLTDAAAGEFDVILVFRVDRLSRRLRELAQIVDELLSCKVALRSITEPFDTANAAGKMMLQLLGVFAEFEHSSIISRTKTGMLRKAQSGSWPGGRVPLGYRFDKEAGLQVEPGEAAVIRKIFEQYTEGKDGSSEIAKRINNEGFRTRTGKKFGRKSVLLILRNPFYVGRFRWQKEEFPSPHEPIISDDTFAAAQALLEQRAEESPGKRLHNQEQRLLSGLIRCGRCGSRLYGVSANSRGQHFAYYACQKRSETKECDLPYIRANEIEEQLLADVQMVFRDEALLEEIWQAAKVQLAESAPDFDDEIKYVNEERVRNQAALDRYLHAFEAGTMSPADCSQRVAELTALIRQLDDQGEALQEQRAALDLPVMRADFLNEILNNLSGVVGAIPAPQKKHLLQLLVEKVLVRDQSTFEVWYRLPQCDSVRTLGSMVAPRGLEPLLPP